MQAMSASSSSIEIRRLSVASLECCKFICKHFKLVVRAPNLFLCEVFIVVFVVGHPAINILYLVGSSLVLPAG
jgi:hypothetical protein